MGRKGVFEGLKVAVSLKGRYLGSKMERTEVIARRVDRYPTMLGFQW